MKGKSTKLPYKPSKYSAKSHLEYVYCDLWGPSRTETLGGARYYISIMDDFSRKLWVFTLKDKSEAFQKFKMWCEEVENEKKCRVQCLRIDNGLEFLSTEFQVYCRNKGIKRHKTVPGNPQQNGIIERMNRTLLDRARCMLLSSGVPKTF